MDTVETLIIPVEELQAFCKRHQIRKLSLFGSALRSDFRPDSDIDMVVEFEPDARVGLLKMAALELELTNLLQRKVDLRTPSELSRYFRQQVLEDALVQYERS
jgi:predicted nucleotidyltransferase